MKLHSSSHLRLKRSRLIAAGVLLASLAGCGGNSGGTDNRGGGSGNNPPAPPPPSQPSVSRCTDPTPDVASTVKFAAPVAPAASSVEISANGTSACFVGTAATGVKSDAAVGTGAEQFYYFEATRSATEGVGVGVSGSPLPTPASGSNFEPGPDSLVISGTTVRVVDAAGGVTTIDTGATQVFGFAVDFRAKYPVVSVFAPASANASCGAPSNSPCLLWRGQLAVAPTALHIYAYGSGTGSAGPTVSINPGSDLAAKPYAYPTASVMALLRTARVQGDRGFNAQWPSAAGGAAPTPLLGLVGNQRAVIRKGDAAPYRKTFDVAPTDTANGTINWKDETGAARGTGASAPLATALINALAAGEHAFTASVINPQTGRYAETTLSLLVLQSTADTDDDGDGLTYSAEKTLGTDPGNADTDGDGLSDGAESGLGTNPLTADNTADAALPRRGALVIEPGITSPGVIVPDDGLSAIFTSELNPDCVQHLGAFAEPAYLFTNPDGTTDREERCRKRAVRANVGVANGEFRYFESRRLGPVNNVGQGIITANGMIDPYCCFVEAGQPGFPYNGTPPSLTINSVGGVFRNLNFSGGTFSPTPFDLDATAHYGFAVDYRGADPVVYLVVKDAAGNMTVSDGITVDNFGGGPAIPMLHGHPVSETVPSLTMNLGLQKFHYDLAAVRTALTARGAANVDTEFKPGIGAHRWK